MVRDEYLKVELDRNQVMNAFADIYLPEDQAEWVAAFIEAYLEINESKKDFKFLNQLLGELDTPVKLKRVD